MARRTPSNHRKVLLALLKEMRLKADLTQAGLARLLKQPQSFVSKYESGERRLDILELREICAALDLNTTNF